MRKLSKKVLTGFIALATATSIVACESEGTINVYTRDASSGTRGAFEELIGFEGALVSSALETSGNGDMATKVGADANAIGYVSLTTDFEANNIKALAFEGVEPSVETVLDESYSLTRPFAFVTRASGDFASEEEEQLTLAFVDFLLNSTEAREAIDSEGGIVDVDAGTAWSELAEKHPIVAQDNSAYTIRTAGSTSVVDTLDAAIQAFIPLAGNVQFVRDHTGSGDGFKRTLGGDKDSANAADIGFASRDFKTDGTEEVSQGAETGTYCLDAVVVVSNAENPVVGLKKDEVYKVFTGELTEWNALGNS